MQTTDNWRDVATDPPPVDKRVIYQDADGDVGMGQRRSLKYHTNPKRAAPWMDATYHTMQAPVLWQPLPEPRKL